MLKGLPRATVLIAVLLLAAPAYALLRHAQKPHHVPVPAGRPLSNQDTTPLPRSHLIVGARWTSPRYDPPKNQQGDILPTIWADDGAQYTLMDDGGLNVAPSARVWRQELARISGQPPAISFSDVGESEPAGGWAVDNRDPQAHAGPLGPYYSSGLVEANHVFYATQENDWNWTANGAFTGLMGIAYSRDRGRSWQSVARPFPAPLGNLNWVIRGRGGVYPDGHVYAIASEREFNANALILGRSRPDATDITDPSRWQWLTGWRGTGSSRTPVFSGWSTGPIPVFQWNSHITYPQVVYDAGIGRYLLTFTYSYTSAPPGVWKGGAELVIAESTKPWGPFSFVAEDSEFGPSNGYGASFPIKWISRDGRDLWLKWAANFDGCSANLDCSGVYGFNYRRVHLTLKGDQ